MRTDKKFANMANWQLPSCVFLFMSLLFIHYLFIDFFYSLIDLFVKKDERL